MSKLIELGHSLRPHGIKGEVALKLYNDDGGVLKQGEGIVLFPYTEESKLPDEGKEYFITKLKFGNKVICQLRGVESREDIELIIPFTIKFPRDKFPKLSEDEFYLEDLIGLEVIDIDGHSLGKVKNHYSNGAQTVLQLSLKTGNIDLPFIEHFFPHINLKRKKITLIIPEYEE